MDTTQAKRRVSLWLLAAILVTVALLAVGGVFAYYLVREELPTLPMAEETEPAFAYSIYGVDEPRGLALSPDGKRLYVTERGGERYVRVFDPQGNLLMNLFPPDSTFRQPTYVAVNPWGHVFVNDLALEGLSIYSPEGEFLGLLNPMGDDADRLERFFTEAAKRGAKLAVAPEGIIEGYLVWEALAWPKLREELVAIAQPLDGPWVRRFKKLAKQLKMCLVFGMAELRGRKDVYNTAVFIDQRGRLCGTYSKATNALKGNIWNFNRCGKEINRVLGVRYDTSRNFPDRYYS